MYLMTVVTGKLILIKVTLLWFLILTHNYCITSRISMFGFKYFKWGCIFHFYKSSPYIFMLSTLCANAPHIMCGG